MMLDSQESSAHGERLPSTRSFGIVMAIVFCTVGTWPILEGGAPRWWSLLFGGAFFLLVLFKPAALSFPNRLWYRFGIALGRVVSPVALGLLFVVVITPMGFLMRVAKKLPIRLDFDHSKESYWIDRDPPAPDPKRFPDQFS